MLYRTLVVSLVWLALFIPVIRKGSQDVTWELSTILVCVTVEANLVVVCGCFPALRLLARRILPKWFGSTEERNAPPPLHPPLVPMETGSYTGREESKTTLGSPHEPSSLTKGIVTNSETMFPFVRSLPTRLASDGLGVLPDP